MMKDHIKCTDFLLSLDDCNVNYPDDNGQTLLTQTARKLKLNKKMKERVVYLVNEKGADVKTVDTNGWTPVRMCILYVFMSTSQLYTNLSKQIQLNLGNPFLPFSASSSCCELYLCFHWIRKFVFSL